MTDKVQHEMTCSQFEALLAEALDSRNEELAGVPAAFRAAFANHRDACVKCGPLYSETLDGMLLLDSLEDVEPPRYLVHNVLAATSRVASATSPTGEPMQAGWLVRVRTRFVPSFAGMLRSRFVASFCMAFFSLSLTFSLSGVKVSDVARMAAHPSELRKSVVLEYTQVQARVMRYYDNMRLVYEVQTRVRELKNAATPAQGNPDKGTGQPDQQNWNQPAPGSPELQPTQESNVQDRTRGERQFNTGCASCSGQAEFKKVAGLTAESMRKNEGAEL